MMPRRINAKICNGTQFMSPPWYLILLLYLIAVLPLDILYQLIDRHRRQRLELHRAARTDLH